MNFEEYKMTKFIVTENYDQMSEKTKSTNPVKAGERLNLI